MTVKILADSSARAKFGLTEELDLDQVHAKVAQINSSGQGVARFDEASGVLDVKQLLQD
jgi:uncharacterized protein YheU (UPF0270 family)